MKLPAAVRRKTGNGAKVRRERGVARDSRADEEEPDKGARSRKASEVSATRKTDRTQRNAPDRPALALVPNWEASCHASVIKSN